MESGPTHKVRLVRCPKCRLLLGEPQGILVYKCGGCDTVLQVKNRKNDANGTTPGSRETETAQMKEFNRVYEVGEYSSSSQAMLPSSGKGSLDQNSRGDKKISRDHVSEVGDSSILTSSSECSLDQNRGGNKKISRDYHSDVGESSSSSKKLVLHSLGECSLDQNEEGDQRISRDYVYEVGEYSISSQKASLPSSGECYLDQNEGGDQITSRDHVSEIGECCSYSQKELIPSSAQCSLDQSGRGDQRTSRDHVCEGGDSSSSSQIAILPSSSECYLDQNGGEDKKISRNHVSEGGESSSSSKIVILPSSGECPFDKNGGGDQKISRDCSSENSEHVNSSDGDRNNVSDQNESQVCIIKHSNEFCSSNGDANHENEELPQFSRRNSERELNEISSLQAGAKSAVHINSDSDSTMRSTTADNMERRENYSTVTSHKPAAENFSSDIFLSSPEEQPKQHQINVNLSYEHRDFFSPRSEVSRKTGNYKAEFPRFRSSTEYDGSVFSFDEMDDQVHDQCMNLHRSTFKATNSVIYGERPRRNKFLGNSSRNCNSEMQHQPSYRKWGGDQLLGSIGLGLPVSNGTRLQDDKFPSQLPFYQRVYPAGYESGSTSSALQDEFHHSSSEQEKIKLLRMVCELQDQINKTCHVNGKADRPVSTGVTGKEMYIPDKYGGEIMEDKFFHDLNHHSYPERWRQERNWPHQHKIPCIPFLGESTDIRQHINCSCMHCHPQDSQFSAPLPPPLPSHNKGVRRFHFHPGHSYYNSYSSCRLSPQQFAASEFPIWHHEAKSDHQRHEDHHMKEKHHLVTRHLRPTAGGAPFITCYNCLNPLQLPADFLVFKRKFHLLRCGACSKVLKFSLERRTHIVPYTPETAAPPRSQLGDYNDAVDRRNSVSSSRGNSCSPADPVSCSDDYGLSHRKSYSTDGDPVILAPFHKGQGNTDGRNLSYDSSESMKERPQFVIKQPGNKYKNPVETQASPGHSLNKSSSERVSSEIEELPARRGSTLHRLMGYSSPSQVLRGSDPSSSETCSHYT